MIKINRPANLADFVNNNVLAQEIEDLFRIIQKDQSVDDSRLKTLKQNIKHTLVENQHNKCCYCETKTKEQGNDVEHFRPQSIYWWLAYEWRNLLFSYQNCNRWQKNDQFPLKNHNSANSADYFNNQNEYMNNIDINEEPILINPLNDDPEEFFKYEIDKELLNDGICKIGATDKDPARALETISILKLNESNELLEWRSSVAKLLLEDIEEYEFFKNFNIDFINKKYEDRIKKETSYVLPYAGLRRYIVKTKGYSDLLN